MWLSVLESPVQHEYGLFVDLVRNTSGIELPHARRNELERLIQQALNESELENVIDLYRHLAAPEGKRDLENFVGELTIGETHFFRNKPQIRTLEEHILPDLISRRRHERRLRIWSAGCASGEEPYSIAILLERLIEDLDNWHVSLLATDVNRKALKKAQAGVYGRWSFRDVDPKIENEYFERRGDRLEILPRVRDRVTLRYLNLVEDSFPSFLTNTSALDLILCRNVLIYFNEPTKRTVVSRFHDALTPGGWLVVGHAEPSQEAFADYETHNFPGAIIYRKTEPVWATSFPEPRVPEPAPVPEPILPERSPAPVETPAPLPPGEEPSLEAALQMWSAGHFGEALHAAAALADADPSDARAPYLAAKFCADRRDFADAQLWVNVALTRDSLSAPAHHLRALILEEEGDLDGALKALRCSLYADATWPLAHYALGALFFRMGVAPRAAKAFDYVLRVLADRSEEEAIPDADGVTVGRLRHLAQAHLELAAEGTSASSGPSSGGG